LFYILNNLSHIFNGKQLPHVLGIKYEFLSFVLFVIYYRFFNGR